MTLAPKLSPSSRVSSLGSITERQGGAANPFHTGETEAQKPKQAMCSNKPWHWGVAAGVAPSRG